MKLIRTVAVAMALYAVARSGAAADVLVSCEDHTVERWRVDGRGNWSRTGLFSWGKDGYFINGAVADVKPTGLAVAGEVVYVGDSRGKILRFDRAGKRLAPLNAALGYRPDNLCISPDGKWLWVSCVLENSVSRYSLPDGKGGAYVLPSLRGPRKLAFGPDGLLYVACRDTRSIRAFDVSGLRGVEKGSVGTCGGKGAFSFTGKRGTTLVVPGDRIQVIDLVNASSALTPKVMENAFAACTVDGVVYVGDWTRGEIFRVDAAAATAERVATGLRHVMAMVPLDDTEERDRRAAFNAARVPLKFRTYVQTVADSDFGRMKFNNPNAVTDLKAGFDGDPYVLDYDGDGQKDLLVYSGWEGQVWEGWWLFRNPTPKGESCPDPVFDPPVRVSRPEGLSVGVCHSADGSVIGSLLKGRQAFDVRQFVDFNGDGLDDLIVSTGERLMPIWDASGYDERGVWTKTQAQGFVYWCRRLAGHEARYAPAEIIRLENGAPMECLLYSEALFDDWDGDGDLDVILDDYKETFTYFENVGTRTHPSYSAGRFLRHEDGERMVGYHCHPRCKAVDWDGDGRKDIIRCEEGGRVCWYRNLGRSARGMPLFERPRYFRQKADELCASAMVAPWVADLDGDGDQDLVSGNTAGTIDIFENLSGPGVAVPSFAPPRPVTTPDGKVFRLQAGPSGSLQGPIESQYGYTCLSVADWDGDGLPDLVCNSVWGKVFWMRNVGTATSPAFDYPRDVEVEWSGSQPELPWFWLKPSKLPHPKALLTQWRTTPVAIDWNQDGLVDLLAMDVEGDLAFFERVRLSDGRLALKAPRKAFRTANGETFLLAYDWKGGPKTQWDGHVGWSGRRKFCVCDWNGDGLLDLIVNGSPNAHIWLQQAGGNGCEWSFRFAGSIGQLDISTHDPQPCACDFDGNGVPDLVVGAMDGYFYHCRNSRLASAATEKRVASGVRVVAAAEGLSSTAAYRVWVDGLPVDVYGIPAPSMHDGQLPETALEPYYAAFFDADREVEVRIDSAEDLRQVRILPRSLGIRSRCLEDRSLVFRARPPFTLAVEPQIRHRALVVSAKTPTVDSPMPDSPGVRYFGPGRYHLDRPIRLKAGETLYLASGAYVEAAVEGVGDGIRVCGHGILSGLCWNWLQGPAPRLMFFKGRDIRIEDVTVMGSYNWTIVLEDCEGAVVRGVNILNGHVLNDDGIDVVRSRGTTISNVFIRTQDDCIAPKHWCEGLTVRHATLWTDVANIFRIGYECDGKRHRFGDFLVSDVDILHQSVHKPASGALWSENAVYVQASNDMSFENMTFENLRFDTPEEGDNLACLRTLVVKDGWQQHQLPGDIRGIRFRNVTFPAGLPERSEMVWVENVDPSRTVKDIRFENMDGKVPVSVRGKVDDFFYDGGDGDR